MKKFAFLLFSAAAVLCWGCSTPPAEGYSIVDGVIVFDVPARAEGQHSVLRLTTDPMPVVRVGSHAGLRRWARAATVICSSNSACERPVCPVGRRRVGRVGVVMAAPRIP